MAKGTEILANEVTLLTAEDHALRQANETLSKRQRARRTRFRQGGAIFLENVQDILAQKEVEEQMRREKHSGEGGKTRGNQLRGAVGLAERPVIFTDHSNEAMSI